MRLVQSRSLRWWLVGLLLAGLLGLVQIRLDIAQRRDLFQANARAAHRLLSQRAAQHDAILATLMLLAHAQTDLDRPEQRLSAFYPQVLQVLRRAPDGHWADPALAAAEAASRASGEAALGPVDLANGRYALVRAGLPASHALLIDLARWVPWDDWPLGRGGPAQVELSLAGQTWRLQPGVAERGWARGVTPGFIFDKPLDTPSQPFALRVRQATGPADWPWGQLALTAAAVALALTGLRALHRQRERRRRAEDLLRLARTARLNAMGELAAGVAHELNQPLTAILASTQAAQRLLDEDPPAPALLREALERARTQARRAADVVARMRRLVERPDNAGAGQTVELGAALRGLLDLLQPELQRGAVRPELTGAPMRVHADPVALEQILHNLLVNALQALEAVPPAERRLQIVLARDGSQATLTLRDSGPGIAPELLARLFTPFSSTKPGGLGLGLSLCESLASAMGGTLSAQNVQPRGAEFRLTLPQAAGA